MARRRRGRQAEEEPVEEGLEEEAAPAGAEFVPEAALKPRSDVYSLILILTFVAFLAGCIISGREAWEHYDVQFWVFTKKQANQGQQPGDMPAEPAPAEATPIDDPGAATPPPDDSSQ